MKNQELSINGTGIGNDIAFGDIFLYCSDLNVPIYDIVHSDIESECKKLEDALSVSKGQILSLIEKSSNDENVKDILEAHILMLEDKCVKNEVCNLIKTELKNIEHVYDIVMTRFTNQFQAIPDKTLAERASDVIDIKNRVIKNMLGSAHTKSNAEKLKGSVVIAKNIIPSEVLYFDSVNISAVVIESGSSTSHSAILFNALGIPSLFGVRNITKRAKTATDAIVDTKNNLIVLNPSNNTVAKYYEIKKEIEIEKESLLQDSKLECVTKDGVNIETLANIDIPEDTDNAIKYGASAIGLYRTEFLYLSDNDNNHVDVLDEERQFNTYKSIVMKFNTFTTIRTLDLGGDKIFTVDMKHQKDDNPFLGFRAIRFCLSNKSIFKTQLHAILRASHYGKINLMIPMVSVIREIIETKKIIEEVKKDLDNNNIDYDKNIKIGVLVETPSAAILIDKIVKHVDFISIGSNDLVQYTLACDRTNEKINYLYNSLDLSVIRLLKNIIETANKNNIPVSMCGEMAGNTLYTDILLGMGLKIFSMSSLSIPIFKRYVRNINIKDCRELVEKILNCDFDEEIKKLIKDFKNKNKAW